MDKAERYRRRYMRTVILQALLVTLAAHFLLVMLFRTAPQKNANTPDGHSGIRLFNIGANSPERRVKIERWLDIHDPSVIARADSSHSAVMRLQPEKKEAVPDVEVSARRPLPVAGRQKEAEFMSVRDSDGLLPVIFSGKSSGMEEKKIEYPRVIANAVPLAMPLTEEMIKLSREVNAGKTVIELDIGAARDRFAVRQSSGSARLDMLLVRQLLANREQFKGGGLHEVTVLWRKRGGK